MSFGGAHLCALLSRVAYKRRSGGGLNRTERMERGADTVRIRASTARIRASRARGRACTARRRTTIHTVTSRIRTVDPLALFLCAILCWSTAFAQENAVTEESSNVSVRGGCGAAANSHGVCGPDGKLRCRTGWAGDLCDEPICKQDCHQLHGSCDKPGECICQSGWRGARCDECVPSGDCQHGTCNGTSTDCHCNKGWSGPQCSQAKCREGCHSTRGYCDAPGECKCRIGWGGPTCEECAVVPGCQNGFCQKPLECRCFPGWSGHLCQNPICADGCHSSHGSCTKPGECRCEVGWFGPTCSTCHPYPGCKNGLCTKPWECICEIGWSGMMCDKRIEPIAGYCNLNPNACLNGGTCVDVLGPRNYTCSCPSLFTGRRCDYLAERRPRPNYIQNSTTTSSTTIASTTTTTTDAAPTAAPITLRKAARSSNLTTGITARSTRSKSTTSQTTTASLPSYDGLEEDDENDPVIEDYDETPRGQHSRIHSVTASPRKLMEQKQQREVDAKNARRLFLQKQATITFRQPKIVPTVRTRSRPLKLPFTVIDRKHLSLPVFLPRVSDVVRKNDSKTELTLEQQQQHEIIDDDSTESPNSTLSSEHDQLSFSSSDLGEESNISNEGILNGVILTGIQSTNEIKGETEILQDLHNISTIQVAIDSTKNSTATNTERLINSHLAWGQDDFNDQLKGEQTIKDLLEEYDKPKPVLVVDYNVRQSKDANEIQKSGNNQIEESLNFINEKRRFLEPESLNLASESSQESTSNGPSRPMFLVAVRPLPHPDGTIRPISSSSGHPMISFSHGNYPSATFLGESRNGKFLPQGRSAGSGRGPVNFSSPSFSVSQANTPFSIRHFTPQTRLSRRIGHASSTPFAQSFAPEDDLIAESDSSATVAETQHIHFYQEQPAGSVHIGVDRHTPREEIYNAFIEIKKSYNLS